MNNPKFRLRNTKTKSWELGYKPDRPDMAFSMFGECMIFGEYMSLLNSMRMEEWDYLILDQWSGEKDEVGMEIFINDIVKCDYGIGQVVFKSGCFMIEWLDDPEANMELLFSRKGTYARQYGEQLTVIGNVFDNIDIVHMYKYNNHRDKTSNGDGKLCYCGHTNRCDCGNPGLSEFKQGIVSGNIKLYKD